MENPEKRSLPAVLRKAMQAGFFGIVKEFISTASHSRTLGLLALLLIIAAVPLTVIVAQQRQEVRQRAATEDPYCQIGTDEYDSPLALDRGTCNDRDPSTICSGVKNGSVIHDNINHNDNEWVWKAFCGESCDPNILNSCDKVKSSSDDQVWCYGFKDTGGNNGDNKCLKLEQKSTPPATRECTTQNVSACGTPGVCNIKTCKSDGTCGPEANTTSDPRCNGICRNGECHTTGGGQTDTCTGDLTPDCQNRKLNVTWSVPGKNDCSAIVSTNQYGDPLNPNGACSGSISIDKVQGQFSMTATYQLNVGDGHGVCPYPKLIKEVNMATACPSVGTGTGQFPQCNNNAVSMTVQPKNHAGPDIFEGDDIVVSASSSQNQGSTRIQDDWSGDGKVDCPSGIWGDKTCKATKAGSVTWTHKWANCNGSNCAPWGTCQSNPPLTFTIKPSATASCQASSVQARFRTDISGWFPDPSVQTPTVVKNSILYAGGFKNGDLTFVGNDGKVTLGGPQGFTSSTMNKTGETRFTPTVAGNYNLTVECGSQTETKSIAVQETTVATCDADSVVPMFKYGANWVSEMIAPGVPARTNFNYAIFKEKNGERTYAGDGASAVLIGPHNSRTGLITTSLGTLNLIELGDYHIDAGCGTKTGQANLKIIDDVKLADLDKNGVVNLLDLGILRGRYRGQDLVGCQPPNPTNTVCADFDRDGRIGFADFEIWLKEAFPDFE